MANIVQIWINLKVILQFHHSSALSLMSNNELSSNNLKVRCRFLYITQRTKEHDHWIRDSIEIEK